MPNNEFYKVAEGRVVILPKSVKPGPGGRSLQYTAGQVIELTPDEVTRLGRHLRNLKKNGDLTQMQTLQASPSLATSIAKKDA